MAETRLVNNLPKQHPAGNQRSIGGGGLCGFQAFNKRKVPKTVHGRILSIK